nr:SIS domain-containing protein [Acidobacteriota bacterium]
AFTCQLVALYLLAMYLGQVRGTLGEEARRKHIADLIRLPNILEQALKTGKQIEEIAGRFYNRTDFLFLGRGINYPIALEGALKLKEISYIHAEGYPAGEMKHGPIALIDEKMPIVAIAPQDHVYEKMLGNIQEAKARGGSVIAITTSGDDTIWRMLDGNTDSIITLPALPSELAPIAIVLPLQLLSYHIAVRRGCDVDQPRNLAKSVTVE